MKHKKLFFNIIYIFLVALLVIPTSYSIATTENVADNITVNAPVALLMDANTGKILYEKDAHKKMYPASTTKIMTAILALENRELSDMAKASYNAIFSVPVGYTNANIQLEEELTIEQLLHVLLIPSANDAANVIAEDIGGSVQSFASMMNTKAIQIGCTNTNFVNPSGIHDENHYSTAYDLALIANYAMQNETFRKIVSTVRYTLPATNKYDKTDRVFLTTNKLINSKSDQYYESAIGTKTGYTDPAKNCLVSSAKKDDLELICIILGATKDTETNINKFSNSISLFEYGFENYTYKKLYSKDDVYKVIKPTNAAGNTKDLNLLIENEINVLIKKSDYDINFVPTVNLNSSIKAPITKGTVLGSISYDIYGINYTTNLIAGQDIEAKSIFIIIFEIALILILLYIFKVFLVRIHRGKKRKKKKKNTRKFFAL